MTPAELRRHLRYDAWANRRLAGALTDEHAEGCRLLAHVLAAQRVWLRRIRGDRAATTAETWPHLSAEEVRAFAHEIEADLGRFAAAVTAEGLQRVVPYQNSKGTAYETSVGDILAHVLLHGAYHRGQAAAALRAAGTAPPVTDFIAFVREGG